MITKNNFKASQLAAIGMISQIYEGLDLEALDSKTNKAFTDFFAVLQDELGLDNIYIFVPDFEENTMKYISIRTRDGSKAFISIHGEEDGVIQEGDEVAHTFTEEEKIKISNGEMIEYDNKYGHSYACYAPIYSDSTHVAISGVIGIEVSFKEVEKEKRGMFFTIYSVFIILALAACVAINFFLRRNVLKRTESMSEEMQNFTKSEFETLQNMHINDYGRDELGRIAESFNDMIDKLNISNREATKLRLEKAKIETELELAGKIQMDMLPELFFKTENVTLNASIKPAAYIGGDFFYYDIAPCGNIISVIGDVSGKGIMAAMVMSEIITVMSAMVKANRFPSEMTKIINNVLTAKNSEEIFVSMFVSSYNPQTGNFIYTDAGHNKPYLIKKDGTISKIESQIDMMTGLFAAEEYHETCISLEAGDRIFLYTDGVNEAENSKGEHFEYERLECVLRNNQEDLIGSVTEAVETFVGEADQSDDITMLVLKIE